MREVSQCRLLIFPRHFSASQLLHDDLHSSVLLSSGLRVVRGHRICFAIPHSGKPPGFDPMSHQELAYSVGTMFREFEIVGLRTDAVGMSFDDDAAAVPQLLLH